MSVLQNKYITDTSENTVSSSQLINSVSGIPGVSTCII